jgi:thymidylate synthase
MPTTNSCKTMVLQFWMSADEKGELGSFYGYQLRLRFAPNGTRIDQINQVIDTLKKNPDSTRVLISAWNVADVREMEIKAPIAI